MADRKLDTTQEMWNIAFLAAELEGDLRTWESI